MGKDKNSRGFTLVELILVVFAVTAMGFALSTWFKQKKLAIHTTQTLRNLAGGSVCEPPAYLPLPANLEAYKKILTRWSQLPPEGSPLPHALAMQTLTAIYPAFKLPQRPPSGQISKWALRIYVFWLEAWSRKLMVQYPSGSAVIKGGLFAEYRENLVGVGARWKESGLILGNNGELTRFEVPVTARGSSLIGHFLWPCGAGEDRIVSLIGQGNSVQILVDGKEWASKLVLEPCPNQTGSNIKFQQIQPMCVGGTFEGHTLREVTVTNDSTHKRMTPAIDDVPLVELKPGYEYL